MDAVTVFSEGLPAIFYFLLFVFVPGFFFSLVIFPRKNSLSALDRLVYSTVLGASSGIALVMIMYSVLGFDITPGNFILATVVFSAVLLMVWVCERWYLNTQVRKAPEAGYSGEPPAPPPILFPGFNHPTGTGHLDRGTPQYTGTARKEHPASGYIARVEGKGPGSGGT